jgi:hypothetical protein
MWWKLALLVIVTAGLIFCIIPIRTHAALLDPANPPTAPRWGMWSMVSNMYLTSGTATLIFAITAVAAYLAFKIVRSG